MFDAALSAVLLAGGLLDWATGVLGGVFPGSPWVHLPFVVLTAAPVAARRPLAASIAVGVAQSVWIYTLYPLRQQPPLSPFLALVLVVYSAAAYADGKAARAAWVTVALGVLSNIPAVIAGQPIGYMAGPSVRC